MRRHPLPALTALVLLAGACTASGTTDTAAPTASATATADAIPDRAPNVGGTLADVPAIVADAGPSVVSVRFAQGEGSGVIYREDGLIVTNNHVVQAAGPEGFEVALANGRSLPGRVVATDARTDLAVVQVEATGLPAATFADQLPDVGQLAVAIGNPLGFSNSVSAGIVSGLDRDLPVQRSGTRLVGLIQTDAPISPGNSGGALVNSEGQVIGINVAKLPSQLNASNVGFAIPATTVVPVVDQLINDGEVSHPYLGIRGGTLSPQVADRFGIDRESGVIVAEVTPDSPAAAAGFAQGDLIVGIDGQPVESFGDLASTLRQHEPGDTVPVTVVRDGQERTLEVMLGELPADVG